MKLLLVDLSQCVIFMLYVQHTLHMVVIGDRHGATSPKRGAPCMCQIRELTNSVISSLNRQNETKCGVVRASWISISQPREKEKEKKKKSIIEL